MNFSIKIRNYKCFVNEAGFDEVQRVNLIIGKNNSGKSSLLDVIEFVVNSSYTFEQSTWRSGQQPQIIFSSLIPQNVVKNVFKDHISGGSIPGNHATYGNQLINRVITWTKTGQNQTSLLECDDQGLNPRLASLDYAQRLTDNMPIPLEGKKFRRVLAERDIAPEPDDSNINIHPNGRGITNSIQCFINRSNLPSDLVERDILNALNEIFAHDATFTDIVCQLHSNNMWEIYLEEEHKGRVALSKSGSGLKTVITVLICLFLVPKLENTPLSNYVFGFEELENNIHPALLRRLNDYLYRSSVDNHFIYFLTTHSNVLIDQFSKQDDAQIIHVTQANSQASCYTAKTYIDNNGILDDLDVRASDILQANGVVWVEGPSDRIYFNRWIELWSEGTLKEGTHYQVIFYGGRLLSHLSADDPDTVEDGISILNANRNAIMLIDSDKKSAHARINTTKRRLRYEFDSHNSLCWITKGKEIENYISPEVLSIFLGTEVLESVDQYSSFFDYLDSKVPGEGKRYSTKKPLFAEKIVQHMTKENMEGVLDLNEMLTKVCQEIWNWNL